MGKRITWVIIADRNGQLGNRLIVFSHFIANALEKGHGVSNPFFNEYAAFFTCSSNNDFYGHPFRSRLLKSERLNNALAYLLAKTTGLLFRIARVSPFYSIIRIYHLHDRQNLPGNHYDLQGSDFLSALKKKFVMVQGWKFRSYADVQKHSDTIRSLFRLKDEYNDRVVSHLMNLRSQYELLVGVHIRRGDYKEFENGKYYYELEDYREIMKGLVTGLFSGKKIGFMVCTNETIPQTAFNGLPVQFGPGHFVEDLYALAGCDYVIGPPSTYSHWAAFYGKIPLARIISKDMNIQSDDFRVPLTL